ncbi:MAG: spore maturation protein [Bacillota bacterium]|jgi:spore maturation protein B
MLTALTEISQWSVPLLLLLIFGWGYKNKVRTYEVFVQGALEGLRTVGKLFPYLLAIFVVIGLFRTSGALSLMVKALRPILRLLQLPPELVTLALIKPLSGSASLAITADLLQKNGPDSSVGMIASIAQGSSETTFYVLSLYLGYVNIKNGRHTLIMGLISELAAFMLAVALGTMISRL